MCSRTSKGWDIAFTKQNTKMMFLRVPDKVFTTQIYTVPSPRAVHKIQDEKMVMSHTLLLQNATQIRYSRMTAEARIQPLHSTRVGIVRRLQVGLIQADKLD
jgi:hypothetical protein